MTDGPIFALRPVEMFPFGQGAETVIVLRDPEGVADAVLSLPLPAFFIASCFNGFNRVADVQQAFAGRFGTKPSADDVLAIADRLEKHCLLQSPSAERKRAGMEAAWQALEVRPPAHAGASYPGGASEFQDAFDGYFSARRGAGILNGPNGAGSLAGLVVPHMDPRCSGPCASWAMKAVGEADTAPDLFIILGTAHQPLPNLFSVLDKDFGTPMGSVPRDRGFVADLRSRFGAQRLGGDRAHRTEHSIEFPVVYLHALLGNPAPFRIVPILCGSLHKHVDEGGSPADDPEMTEFCRTVKELASERGNGACFIAGVDLAHVGKKFGDEAGLSSAFVEDVSRRDLDMLAHVRRLDREAFFQHVRDEKDKRRICGLTPIYTMLGCMDASRGELSKYDYNLDPRSDSMVSFCSMAFYR